tara:strand:- start:4895 stop:5386 length:492 start_codon:yes stop_codon:yes gene_type:complete
MKPKKNYSEKDIYQLEKYLFNLYEYIFTKEFELLNKNKKILIQEEITEMKAAIDVLRNIFNVEEYDNEKWVAYNVDIDKKKKDGFQTVYKFANKSLLYNIFDIKLDVHFQRACQGNKNAFKSHDGWTFIKLDKYIDLYGNPGFNTELQNFEAKILLHESEKIT